MHEVNRCVEHIVRVLLHLLALAVAPHKGGQFCLEVLRPGRKIHMTIRCIAITLVSIIEWRTRWRESMSGPWWLCPGTRSWSPQWRLCSCAAHQCVSRGGLWQSSFWCWNRKRTHVIAFKKDYQKKRQPSLWKSLLKEHQGFSGVQPWLSQNISLTSSWSFWPIAELLLVQKNSSFLNPLTNHNKVWAASETHCFCPGRLKLQSTNQLLPDTKLCSLLTKAYNTLLHFLFFSPYTNNVNLALGTKMKYPGWLSIAAVGHPQCISLTCLLYISRFWFVMEHSLQLPRWKWTKQVGWVRQ